MTSREEFLKKIQATFALEATESIASMTTCLLDMESDTSEEQRARLVETVFREAHSLKGAARAVNVTDVETICQALENVFSALKHHTIELHPGLFDLFHQTVNTLNQILHPAESGISVETGHITALTARLQKAEAGELEEADIPAIPVSQSPSPTSDPPASDSDPPSPASNPLPLKQDETIRVSVERLDSLLCQSEEMYVLNQVFQHIGQVVRSSVRKLVEWNQASSEAALQGTIPRNKEPSAIASVEAELKQLLKFTHQEAFATSTKIEAILDEVKDLISVPVSSILEVFPKAARDISKDKGKEVSVAIRGGEVEVDRRILEEIRHPLMHLLRNCIDHGIETPEIRRRQGKPEKGAILFVIDRMENNIVQITVSDDGSGIDLDKVKQTCIRHHMLPADGVDIPEQTLLNSIFLSGFSTSEMITDLSGRGLGLAIVQEKVTQLGGNVVVKSTPGKGTEFTMRIPLTLVSFRGVRIRLGDHEFMIPTFRINRVLRLDNSEVKTVEAKATIPFNNGVIPLVSLAQMLELPVRKNDEKYLMVVILGSMNQFIGFAVDEIMDEEIVLMKKFNPQLKRVRNVAGATVLGSGKVIPILNVSDLLKSAMKDKGYHLGREEAEQKKEKSTVLVVEDSITSRMLLKNILESAGYRVTTAIDGTDGYTKLKEERFNLVVSDVDMPRLNGFDLTAKIRADNAFSELPVVLVTSLSKREDRERGMEVGANAYIVKSSFDQSNLLEVVERLL